MKYPLVTASPIRVDKIDVVIYNNVKYAMLTPWELLGASPYSLTSPRATSTRCIKWRQSFRRLAKYFTYLSHLM